MVDNFELIKTFIVDCDPNFDANEDSFYSVEIIYRHKDGDTIARLPLSGSNHHRCIKLYYINKLSDLDNYKDEIIALCNLFNARAYISVNEKSYEAIVKANLVEIANRVANNDYKKPQAILQSVISKYVSKNKKWIIDIDSNIADSLNITPKELVNKLTEIIDSFANNTIIKVIQTKSGFHIITKPFNIITFEKQLALNNLYSKVFDRNLIKKNNPTILYAK